MQVLSDLEYLTQAPTDAILVNGALHLLHDALLWLHVDFFAAVDHNRLYLLVIKDGK